jgi:hypothetical protein
MAALMSCPWARKVLVPAAEAGPLRTELADEGEPGELAPAAGALPGLEACAAVVPLDELQAVTSKAAHASDAQPATCRALRAFVVNMEFLPLNVNFP